jgi:hypothetical protein
MILALNLNSAMRRLVLGEELGEQAAQGHTVFVDKPSGSCSRSCEIPDCSTDRGHPSNGILYEMRIRLVMSYRDGTAQGG